MMTREQFEALVRAEAERRWPMPDDEPDFTSLDRQTAYIAARMEHEWPLVEALTNLHDTAIDARALVAGQQTPIDRRALIIMMTERLAEARAALSPYATKPNG